MRYFLILLISVVCAQFAKGSDSTSSCPTMTNNRMAKIIAENAQIQKGQPGFWILSYKKSKLIIVTDETHNRMRIFSPIIESKKIKKKKLRTILEANFDKALDAKYSIYEGYLCAVFTHPLKELTTDQFINAMDQVQRLVATFGTTYTSSDLIFRG